MINAAAEWMVSLGRKEGGWRVHIPGAVSPLCMCACVCVCLRAAGKRLLKADRGEDCSHQHLGPEWPLMLHGGFDGSGYGGMLPALPPHPKSPQSCGMRRKLLLGLLEWD